MRLKENIEPKRRPKPRRKAKQKLKKNEVGASMKDYEDLRYKTFSEQNPTRGKCVQRGPLPNETKLTHTYLPTYLPNKTAPNETGGEREGSL